MSWEFDREVIQLAERQHGVVTRPQLLALGMSDKRIRRRLQSGLFRRAGRGIYYVGGATPDLEARAMAALLSIPNSVLSHQTAAELHGFRRTPRGLLTLTAPPGSNHRFCGATVHEYAGIEDAETRQISGLSVTSPELTILHLSTVMSPGGIARVLDDCLVSRKVELQSLNALAEFWTRQGRPRGRAMRRILGARGPGYIPPESELEHAFLRLVAAQELPNPTRQFTPPWVRGAGRVDFAYERERIIIEVDGRRWHTREQDFAKDRARDRAAQLNGWVILRFTWDEVVASPRRVASEIRQALELDR